MTEKMSDKFRNENVNKVGQSFGKTEENSRTSQNKD